MTLKRSLMLCYSQAKQGTLGRAELERMKNIAMVSNSCTKKKLLRLLLNSTYITHEVPMFDLLKEKTKVRERAYQTM